MTPKLWRDLVNRIRKYIGKMPVDERTCWQKFFIDITATNNKLDQLIQLLEQILKK